MMQMQHVSVDNLGWVPKSPVLVSSLNRAHTYAVQQQHRQLTLDHLLLALTEDSDALVVLRAGNVDIDKLRNAVSDLVGRDGDRAILPDLAGPAASSDVITIFEYASAAADQSGRGTIDGAIVLAALIGEGNSSAARLLQAHGLTFEHAITSLQNMAASQTAESRAEAPLDLEQSDQIKTETISDSARLAKPTPPPTVPVPAPKRQIKDSSRLVSPNPRPVPTIAPDLYAAPAAAQPAAQPPAPQSAPQAPPQPPPQPAPAPAAPRRGINENTGSAGPAPRTARRIGAGERRPAQGNQMANPTAPVASPAEDGMIAPWPDPTTAAPPPPGQLPPRAHPNPASARPRVEGGGMRGRAMNGADAERSAPRTQSSTPLSPMVGEGQLIENIPRKMRVGVPEQIEVRIARNSVTVPTDNMQGRGAPQSYEMYVTKAMTVRLRAPQGGVRIETSSPETQWIDNALGLIQDDFASWRWTITPEIRGTTKLQLVVSARTVGSDGVAAETALPDQVFDIVIRMNYIRTAKRLTGWALAAGAGGIITAFGEDAYIKVLAFVNQI